LCALILLLSVYGGYYGYPGYAYYGYYPSYYGYYPSYYGLLSKLLRLLSKLLATIQANYGYYQATTATIQATTATAGAAATIGLVTASLLRRVFGGWHSTGGVADTAGTAVAGMAAVMAPLIDPNHATMPRGAPLPNKASAERALSASALS